MGILVVQRGKFVSTSQKHYPDLGSDTSSVWNFCARFSDVILRETVDGVVKCQLFSQPRKKEGLQITLT